MEQVMSAYNWVIENSGTIITTATAIVAGASAIAAMTPTPRDDGWVKKAYALIDWFALNVGKAKDKGTPDPKVCQCDEFIDDTPAS